MTTKVHGADHPGRVRECSGGACDHQRRCARRCPCDPHVVAEVVFLLREVMPVSAETLVTVAAAAMMQRCVRLLVALVGDGSR